MHSPHPNRTTGRTGSRAHLEDELGVKGRFSPATVSRGQELFRRGAVTELQRGAEAVTATVVGRRPYAVWCSFDRDGLLDVDCTCPAFEYQLECKHVWAMLIAVAAGGGFAGENVEPGTGSDVGRRREFEVRLSCIESARDEGRSLALGAWSRHGLEIGYALDEHELEIRGDVRFQPLARRRRKDGSLGAWKPQAEADRRHGLGPDDLEIQRWLSDDGGAGREYGPPWQRAEWCRLDEGRLRAVAPLLARAPHVFRYDRGRLVPLRLDPGGWRFEVRIEDDAHGRRAVGWAVRGDERRPLASQLGAAAASWKTYEFVEDQEDRRAGDGPLAITRTAWCLFHDVLGPLDVGEAAGLAFDLCVGGPIVLPVGNEASAIARLTELAGDRMVGAGSVGLEPATPTPCLRFASRGGRLDSNRQWLECRLEFLYGTHAVGAEVGGSVVTTAEGLVVRDSAFERRCGERLAELGLRPVENAYEDHHGSLHPKQLVGVVQTLLDEGWQVHGEGRAFTASTGSSARVTTGVDWFGVAGEVSFDGQEVELPEILRAARSGRSWVRLGDGRLGILPTDWLERWGWLELGEQGGDQGVRFPRQQAWLLDALLAERRDVAVDAGFRALRKKLRAFDVARSLREPRGLRAELRAYQREGLGWLDSLTGLGLGGCLADDMGLGKTVQVLALLERRRSVRRGPGDGRRPSLVVAPRSVLFNWVDEARRFAPRITCAEHHGPGRAARLERTLSADLVVTTYATLRLDIARLRDVPFDVVVLDEAQAIKNAKSQVAKAARLLQAEHRFALSGTPIENRLDELWSLFEFLNPGMLGGSQGFKRLLDRGGGSRSENLASIARGIRPFFLRRTKAQVLAELPEKTEQTVYVELPPKQRKAYRELAEYFRNSLLGAEDAEPGNKIEILTALLRLRQCACHEGLIDPNRLDAPSAKLDELTVRLTEITREGNKALVFSQFTRFLGLLRTRLETAGIRHEYLDGRTRDRKRRVERFQSDPDTPLFLVSLKAGGTGLNLTAADYVFLLDPWWNPAVESQAIDRAHRLGRTRPVHAYRIVAKDTIEERVRELQSSKRELVSTLFDERSGSIANLSRADLELLFS